VRGGGVKYNRRHVEEAVDASLKRLGTDYIDLYQTHWPERPANYFGKLGYRHDADAEWTPFEEVLEAIDGVVKAGKVRAFGASNETAWGVVAQLRIADDKGLPRVSAVQNPYGLLNRAYEVGLAEVSIREDCGLLAYSPLGFGALTGKHLDGATKPSSRQALFPEFQRYFNARAEAATRKYVDLAVESGLDPAVMALAFINMQPFLTANIVGARTTDQLAANLASADLVLPPDVLTAIEAIHAEHTYPSP
jgi:aryl-alcohol dehydrogenase-like predicted oxidoreductase